jgi:pimeloyl-ACP methyl ester carboxylesterase
MAQRGSVSLSGAFLDTAAQGLPSNRLRDEFHQVWVNYCSSDAWHGDGLYQDQRVNPVTGNGLEEVINSWKAQLLGSSDRRVQAQGLVLSLMQPSFLAHFCVANQCSVHFAGAKIVEALLEDLRLNRGLTNPQMILLAGSSAGSMGVRQNLDRLARAARNRWPRVVVVGASDSGHYAEPLNEVAARQPLPSLDSSCSVLGAGPVYPTPLLLPAVTATGAQFWGSARVDETCLRTRLGGPAPVPATPAVFQAQDECREHDRLLPAIATPLFLFQGYRDRVFLPDGAANNVSCNNPAGISPAVTRASYNELLASARGVFGVDSEIHTSLQSTSFFNLLRTDLTVSASPLSHYTILWNWLKTRGTYRHAILECPPGCAVACGTQACP